ncbi:Gfo/Idh/MocA family oxidoreductase [Saliphagus sp. GCM10025308]
MGHRHARSFRRADGCRVAACVDIVADHAAAFGDEFGLDDDQVFTDVQAMLDGATPDVVSICTPPSTHGSWSKRVPATSRCRRSTARSRWPRRSGRAGVSSRSVKTLTSS